MSHLAARREVRDLIQALDLPGSARRPAGTGDVGEAMPIAAAPLVVAD
jgi:hypothetical protein